MHTWYNYNDAAIGDYKLINLKYSGEAQLDGGGAVDTAGRFLYFFAYGFLFHFFPFYCCYYFFELGCA